VEVLVLVLVVMLVVDSQVRLIIIIQEVPSVQVYNAWLAGWSLSF